MQMLKTAVDVALAISLTVMIVANAALASELHGYEKALKEWQKADEERRRRNGKL